MHTRKKPRWILVIALLAAFGLVAAACGDDGDVTASTTEDSDGATSSDGTTDETSTADPPVTQGPNGEPSSLSSDIVLTADEATEVQGGGYTAALLWHTSGAFTDAVSQGERDAFAELGIEVIAETEAGFDAAQ